MEIWLRIVDHHTGFSIHRPVYLDDEINVYGGGNSQRPSNPVFAASTNHQQHNHHHHHHDQQQQQHHDAQQLRPTSTKPTSLGSVTGSSSTHVIDYPLDDYAEIEVVGQGANARYRGKFVGTTVVFNYFLLYTLLRSLNCVLSLL